MLVIPSEIVTFTSEILLKKASIPILVTLYPSISDGITRSEAVPLYPFISAVPSSRISYSKFPLSFRVLFF